MKADRIVSVIFILIALVFWSQTIGLQYNCSIFPQLILIFLVLSSASMFAQTFFAKDIKRERLPAKDLKYIVISIIIVFVWIYLLDILGFIVTSVICLSILTFIFDLERPTPIRALSSVAIYTLMVLVFWFIFHKFLLVPLPTGYLI
ncbi:MAG: tripartite tricarboxylate transporter TctB family protein [Syntrophales bacterium]|nr:tripartite tricarboxylate transporter TctB family protein [Syntrophales bacterium]